MPVAGCVGAASPCAPSTSTNGFIASATSSMCDLPSLPLYTRQIFGMAGPLHGRELAAAERDIDLARGRDGGVRRLSHGGTVAGHGRAVHHPPVAAFVPRPAAVEHAAVVPHDEVAGPPAVRVHELRPG